MCYKQKCKVVSLNLAHPVEYILLHLVTHDSLMLSTIVGRVLLIIARSDRTNAQMLPTRMLRKPSDIDLTNVC